MKRLLIAIPVYINNDLHLEFTQKTIKSIHKANHTNHLFDILIVSSYTKNSFRTQVATLSDRVIFNSVNGVSIAWNTGIKYGLENKYDYIFVTNNDIIYHPLAFDNLIDFAQEHQEMDMWTCAEWKGKDSFEERLAIRDFLKDVPVGEGFDEHPHFSAFMITPHTVEKLAAFEQLTKEAYIGLFDENLAPAYFEDGDMHQRFIRAGMKAGHTATSLFYHYGSRTIKTDPDLDSQNFKTYEKNRNYFISKWGFDPHNRVVEINDPVRFSYKGAFEPNDDK